MFGRKARQAEGKVQEKDVIEAGNRYVKLCEFIDKISFLPEEARQWCKNKAMERFLDLLDRFINS